MTSRRPLVVVAGQARQLPAGDTIDSDAIVSAIPRGTAWPVSPSTYNLYHRTDLGVIGEWDGARWLGPRQDAPMTPWNAGGPWAANSSTHLLTTNGGIVIVAINDCCLLTPNNASNYWTIAFANNPTAIVSLSTATSPDGTAFVLSDTTTRVLSSSTLVTATITKFGLPGPIRHAPIISYRRIYP
jgi:hypothetical protein